MWTSGTGVVDRAAPERLESALTGGIAQAVSDSAVLPVIRGDPSRYAPTEPLAAGVGGHLGHRGNPHVTRADRFGHDLTEGRGAGGATGQERVRREHEAAAFRAHRGELK